MVLTTDNRRSINISQILPGQYHIWDMYGIYMCEPENQSSQNVVKRDWIGCNDSTIYANHFQPTAGVRTMAEADNSETEDLCDQGCIF